MANTRLSNSGTGQSSSLVPDSDSKAAEHNGTGLRVLMAAAARDGDEAALRELQEIESAPSPESEKKKPAVTRQTSKDRLDGLEFSKQNSEGTPLPIPPPRHSPL
jgi:hypothetical protein